MQPQHISNIYPNVISITKIRQDIDALMDLLEKYHEVNVLRGQDVIFKVVKIEPEEQKKKEMRQAIAYMKYIAKKYKTKKGKISATEWLIHERDRMRTKKYYAEHNR